MDRLGRIEEVVNQGDPNNNVLRYSLSLKFTHPSADLAGLSEALAWAPRVIWRAGEEWRTSDGILRGTGVRLQSYWLGCEYEEDTPRFMRHLVELIDHVEERGDLANNHIRSGGCITLSVGLHGELVIADTLEAEELMRMARMGIDLDLECFPKFNRRPL